MKCINKLILVFACLLLFSGCGKKELDFSYDLNSSISAYRFDTEASGSTADSFASDLCVINDAMTPEANTNVDMTHAGSAALFDTSGKHTMYAKNPYKTMYPASLTKVMTALLALKYGKLDDTVTASQNVLITESGAQLCGFKPGDKLTLEQALHGLLMYSGNDAGVLIAEHISGDLDSFAALMNEEAKKLGATNTNFMNPHGLSDDQHYTTAYDLYLIFNEAMKYEKFKEIIHTNQYTTIYHDVDGNEKDLKFNTTNQYLTGNVSAPDGVTIIGGKTGTTNAAGACLILLSKNSAGEQFISVVLQAENRDFLYEEMTDMLNEIN